MARARKTKKMKMKTVKTAKATTRSVTGDRAENGAGVQAKLRLAEIERLRADMVRAEAKMTEAKETYIGARANCAAMTARFLEEVDDADQTLLPYDPTTSETIIPETDTEVFMLGDVAAVCREISQHPDLGGDGSK